MFHTLRPLSRYFPAIAAIFVLLNLTTPAIASEPSSGSPAALDKSSAAFDIRNTTRLQWISPDGRPPITYDEWFAAHGTRGPLRITEINQVSPPGKEDAVKFAVIVNSALYPPLQSDLQLYVLDLAGEGYEATIYIMSGGNPSSLRAFLQSQYAVGLQGCILIGDLPVPWYETADEEFPCDLFYMDMDGAFGDADADGMYDSHTGNVAPEIWIGRLTPSPMTLDGANQIDILHHYFDKDHRYRCGLMPVANRALVYVDDDWAGPGWSFDMAHAYSLRTTEYDQWTTWAPDYMSRLPQDYEFIGVYVHSWSGGHAFKNPLDDWSWMYNYNIKSIQPTAHFYNLFACSNARYVENDYCSGWYIFGPDHGLVSIGSAKTGSMLNFQDFYGPFGEGKPIGQAFYDWFKTQAVGGYEQWEVDWYYGMTLCGDPTLTIQQKPSNSLLQFDGGSASYMMALPDPSLDLFNVRFTPAQTCTLSTVTVNGVFPEIPVRMYIWNSDGTYPTTVIDSVDIPDGDLGLIDISDLNLEFKPEESFHIGFTSIDPAPAETLWIYMDDGSSTTEPRSGLYQDGQWKTLSQFWGTGYNFLIRVEVRQPAEPQVSITTLTLPDGIAGENYNHLLELEGGTPPYQWEINAGTVPAGLTIDPSLGVLSGVPAATGLFHLTVRVSDASATPLTDFQHYDFAFSMVCGDANCDGNVNVADAVYIINYVFKSGPPPSVLDAADANGDGDVNVADGVYLINYVFKSGPAPDCPQN